MSHDEVRVGRPGGTYGYTVIPLWTTWSIVMLLFNQIG